MSQRVLAETQRRQRAGGGGADLLLLRAVYDLRACFVVVLDPVCAAVDSCAMVGFT